MKGLVIILLHCVMGNIASNVKMWSVEEETSEFWNKVAQDDIRKRIVLQEEGLNRNVAKNIILFLGDGMGIPTVTAGRILKGQMQNKSGEETHLTFDNFPHTATSKTYSVDKQTSDSACTGTAFLCGVKTNNRLLGLNGNAKQSDCASSKGNEVKSILIDAYEAGKSTGIVTMATITHATPAAAYAHCPYRKWYTDADLPDEAKRNGCKDIAQQFMDESEKITVALGSGREHFRPTSLIDEEYSNVRGERTDGQDLIKDWLNSKQDEEVRKYVWNQTEFDSVDVATTDRLLGLFNMDYMQYEVERGSDGAGEPSLSEMTEKALQILTKNKNGFFLLVEGAKIDKSHHKGSAFRALHELVMFDKSVEIAKQMTSPEDTLIVVTADHSQAMTIGGESFRGNSIFGLAPSSDMRWLANDGKPYTTLLYSSGVEYQGSGFHLNRENLSTVDTDNIDYKQQTAVPRRSASHSGEDVAIYASGPMAHLFHGVQEQSYIPHVFRYASCSGGVTEHCDRPTTNIPITTPRDVTEPTPEVNFIGYQLSSSEASVALTVNFILVICLAFIAVGLLVKSLKSSSDKETFEAVPTKEGREETTNI